VIRNSEYRQGRAALEDSFRLVFVSLWLRKLMTPNELEGFREFVHEADADQLEIIDDTDYAPPPEDIPCNERLIWQFQYPLVRTLRTRFNHIVGIRHAAYGVEICRDIDTRLTVQALHFIYDQILEEDLS
jgi:hypothetical protein